MIFVTIGTQEPFDRLIKAVDEIASSLDMPVIAQVSTTNYKAKNMKTVEFISPTEFNAYFAKARLVISHAGMGTIISALEQEKPIIVMPRLTKFREHRNEHQLATAIRLDALKYIQVAYNEKELKDKVLTTVKSNNLGSLHKINKYASNDLIDSIHKFIMA